MTSTSEAPPSRRLRGWLIAGAAIAFGVLIAAVAWVGVHALLVQRELAAVVPLADGLRTVLSSEDPSTVSTTVREIDVHASRAAELADDPLWRAAEAVPVVGPNLTVARVAADQLTALSGDVISPLLSVATQLRAGGGSGVDLAGLRTAAPVLETSARTAEQARRELDALPVTQTVPQLARGVEKLRDTIDEIQPTVWALSAFARVAPGMLGADGPRTILIILQNNAEMRTGGGITGTFALVRAVDGHLTLQTQADSTEFPFRNSPILPIPDALTTLYGDVVGRFVQDTSIPSDFDLTARLASAWWQSHGGAAPDEIVSIDPFVLQALLRVTGPLTLPDGSRLTADDFVQRILVDPYMTLSSDQQTVFFAEVTSTVFSRLFDAGIDPLAWIRALAQPVEDGRVSVWSSHAAEQKALSSSVLGGPAARHALAGSAYAVYVNDNTGGKMGTYLKTRIDVGSAQCRPDGKRTVEVDVSLTSTAPADAGARFPVSMTGGGLWGVAPGDIGLIISVAAPKGAFTGGVRSGGVVLPAATATDAGFPTTATHVTLHPGQTQLLRFRYIVDGGARRPAVLYTPLVNDPTVATMKVDCG